MQQEPSIPTTGANTTPDEPENPIHTGSGTKSDGAWKGALSTIAILIAAPLIAVLLTAFVFQSYEVDGPSMETTLQNRDRLIVWKMPRTLSRITKHEYVPARGDVIVFVKHGVYEQGSGAEKQLIKRVIGVPGDRVVVADGYITIYNDIHPDGFNPDAGQEFTDNITKPTTGNVDITVGDNEVFVSGDNRTNSLDSRSFGTVASNDIVGKMVLRIFPLNSFESFL